jgi:hypothetical protein
MSDPHDPDSPPPSDGTRTVSGQPPLPREAPTLPPGPLTAGSTTPAPGPAGTGPAAGGRVVVPGYEVLAELGRGGMGVVYKARQLTLNRTVALKMILAGGHASEAELARFRSEAEAIARLQHPNIVQVHEVGEQDGLPFFSLEFCAGGSLADRLDGTPLPARDAAHVVESLARAVHDAHRAGIVHRDLKPANVLLAADGTPKVSDFGLAKRLDAAAGQTASGAILGTPSYMAPEQAGGRAREVGPPADVYALGAILYELLAGRPPFQAATALDTILQVLEFSPERPRSYNHQVDPSLEAICLKCLEKEPRDRYASAENLAEDLRAYLQGAPVLADGSARLRVLRLLMRESRHAEVLARWGRVWLWHAAQIFLLFLVTNVLVWADVVRPWPYVALWGAGLASLLVPVWHYRFRGGTQLTPVERQLGQVWGLFAVTAVLTGVINHLMGMEVWKLLPLVVLECGFAFGCMAALLGGSFYGMALACAALALVMAKEPRVGPIAFGTAFAIGLFIPGWRYARRAARSGGGPGVGGSVTGGKADPDGD